MIRFIGATILTLALAVPVAAQDVDDAAEEAVEETAEAAEEVAEGVTEAAEETGEAVAEGAEATAEVAEDAADAAAEAVEAHDWEFSLAATDQAPGASGEVKVTEGEGTNAFAIEVSGLPAVDELDTEARDVNAYTVWIVPSKDRVREATLAGVLNVDPASGAGAFEGTTTLESFGVIVSATADGAPASIGGVPVLTGIPVTPAAAEAVQDAADAVDDAGEAIDESAEEMEEAGDPMAETTEEAAEIVDEAGEEIDEAAEAAEEAAEDTPPDGGR